VPGVRVGSELVTALARAVHLLAAGEMVRRGYPCTPVAVCGEPVTSGPEGEDDPNYCPDCVRAAIQGCARPVGSDGRG
jgi:hypothetical protein